MQPSLLSSLVWWALRDLRNRYLRLLRSFRELGGPATTAGKRVFAAAEENLRRELLAFEKELELTQRSALTIALEDNNYPNALQIVRGHRQEYSETARQLFPHLPLGPHPPEDLRFFLMRSLGLDLDRPEEEEVFSLSYSGSPYWEMKYLPPDSDEATIAVVPVPFPESLTPLRWPLLVHELGHVCNHQGSAIAAEGNNELSAAIRPLLPGGLPDDEKNKSAHSLADELIADAVAYLACGRAYIWAFVTEALFQDQLQPWAAHLTRPALQDATTRIRILDPAFDLGDIPDAVSAADQIPLGVEQLDQIAQELSVSLNQQGIGLVQADELSERAMREVRIAMSRPGRYPLETDALPDGERLEELRKTLLAAVGTSEETTEALDEASTNALRKELAEHPSPGVLDKSLAADQVVEHIPATDGDVLTAAWDCSLSTEQDQREVFAQEGVLGDGKLDPARLESGMDRVVKFDTSVARSLESAAVHRWLRKYLPA